MSLPELTNIQLNSKEKNDSKYLSSYSKSNLPSQQKAKGKWFIVNLDSGPPGTHWVLVYNCEPELCSYFDSYGVEPPTEVKKFMIDTNKECEYNDLQLQALGSTQCGWWCMYVASQMEKGQSLVNIVAKAAKSKNPDRFLQTQFHKK
jgi:activator of 2-hydroxyglutaryl-CoA dehydratase